MTTSKNEAKETASTSLAVLDHYAVSRYDPATIREVMAANLRGNLSEFDLDRIHVPSGGGKHFAKPGLSGAEEVKEITGVIVAWREPRAYWKTSFDASGGGTPPDCSSDDGEQGTGDPGGECDVCPMAQFGSAEKGDGQACRQARMLFLVEPENLLPIVVVVPPSSLKLVAKYFLRLSSKALPFYGVVSKLSLEQDRSKTGIAYSAIRFDAGAVLSPVERERMQEYAAVLSPSFARVRPERGE